MTVHNKKVNLKREIFSTASWSYSPTPRALSSFTHQIKVKKFICLNTISSRHFLQQTRIVTTGTSSHLSQITLTRATVGFGINVRNNSVKVTVKLEGLRKKRVMVQVKEDHVTISVHTSVQSYENLRTFKQDLELVKKNFVQFSYRPFNNDR